MNEYLLEQAIKQDLDWILNAPPLLAEHPMLWSPESLKNEQIQLLSNDIMALTHARNTKLGGYFESMVSHLFQQHRRFNVLAKNKVIQSPERTLGELDLLIEDLVTGEVIHLELALKFYLWVPGTRHNDVAWVGAGLKDFLATKVHRLYHHQLKLPEIAQKAGYWPKDLPFPDRHALWMPGRLYLPNELTSAITSHKGFKNTPWRLNPNAETSYWYERSHFGLDGQDQLIKSGWLNGYRSENIRTTDEAFLPAQFASSDNKMPVYVLPTQWQTKAQVVLEHYLYPPTS